VPPAFERFIVFSSYAACTRMRNSIAQRPSTSATKRRWARMASCIVHMSGRQLTGPTCGRLGPSGRLAVFARHAAALGKDAAQRDAREPAALPRPRTARTYAGHMHARFTPRAHTRCEQTEAASIKANPPRSLEKGSATRIKVLETRNALGRGASESAWIHQAASHSNA